MNLTFKQFVETFNDIGKLSNSELKKGQKLNKDETNNFNKVSSSIFYKAINKIKSNDIAKGLDAKGLEQLSIYSKTEYSNMDCYLGINNSSGYCIKKGDLVSVFSTKGSSGSAIVRSAIVNGAKSLDCFANYDNGKLSGILYSLYSRNGFILDKNKSKGKIGEPYSIQNGISRYVDDNGIVQEDNPNVVIFMKLK